MTRAALLTRGCPRCDGPLMPETLAGEPVAWCEPCRLVVDPEPPTPEPVDTWLTRKDLL